MAWARTLDDKLYKNDDGEKVRTDDYEQLPVELWNSSTVMAYLDYLNVLHLKSEPKTTNLKLTRMRIAGDVEKFGMPTIKRWMELAIKQWGGSARFPTASYMQLRQFKWDGIIDEAIREIELQDYHDPNELSEEELDDLFA